VAGASAMPRALLILVLLAAGASARKKQSKAKPPQQHAAAAPAAGAGMSSEAPGPMRSRSSVDDGAAFVRHLFSTPLYVADISDSVDVNALSALALDGYSIIEDNPTVQQELRDLKLAMHGATSAQISESINDDRMFTHNDKFFFWQMGNEAKCERGPSKECANVRWDGFWDSEALRAMRTAIDAAVPQYFETLGVPASEIPPYQIKLWASVMVPVRLAYSTVHSNPFSVVSPMRLL
jgi:hypothetical protein